MVPLQHCRTSGAVQTSSIARLEIRRGVGTVRARGAMSVARRRGKDAMICMNAHWRMKWEVSRVGH